MGSPRIKGNTDLLMDEALKGAQSQGAEVEKIVVAAGEGAKASLQAHKYLQRL